MVMLGLARLGDVWHGMVFYMSYIFINIVFLAQSGVIWLGEARSGTVWSGKVR